MTIPSRKVWIQILMALVCVASSSQAIAAYELFYVNPDESRIRIDSALFEVRVPWNQIHQFVALEQGGLPGTTNGTLPGGGTSNGFETFLTGELLIKNDLLTLNQLTVDPSASNLIAGAMGSWLPGASGGPSEPANAGFHFTMTSACAGPVCDAVSVDLDVAIRGFQVAPDGPLTLLSIGTDLWSASGILALMPTAGRVQYDSTVPGFNGNTPIAHLGSSTTISAVDARYEILSPDLAKLTLPFTTDLIHVLPEDMALDLDATLNSAYVSGEIVAYSQPVPEPSTLLLLGPGLLLLFALERASVGRANRRA
jgi:hypothetical protein